jgi:7-carboxy-7-deazaguanine synthase
MKNQQAPEPRNLTNGQELLVNSIFPTIQGEGPHTGSRAIFIRLAGCNLQCPMCDTEYTTRTSRNIQSILQEVNRISHVRNIKLVVLTGGEPFRQNIYPLITKLTDNDYRVQIETNGVLPIDDIFTLKELRLHRLLDVVVSPKTARVNEHIWHIADYAKYIASSGNVADDGLPLSALEHPLSEGCDRVARPPEWWSGIIYVNPQDSGDPVSNRLNHMVALNAVLNYGYPRRVLGVQLHKIYEVN